MGLGSGVADAVVNSVGFRYEALGSLGDSVEVLSFGDSEEILSFGNPEEELSFRGTSGVCPGAEPD